MLRINILFDNRTIERKFTYAWGFSCLIEGLKHNILFDTGGRGDILLHNMKKMNIEIDRIEHIFLSHIHGDHTGGLTSILERKSSSVLWIPDSFPESLKFDLGSFGIRVRSIDMSSTLFEGVYSTGQLGRSPKEHALIIDTKKGLIMITGCSHPGVANLAIKAVNYLSKDIYLIVGGFHLRGYSKKDIDHIVKLLKDMGVKKIAPCHCTGEYAMQLFEEQYQENYLDVSVGTTIQL